MTTTEQPTLEHKVETVIDLHNVISAEIKTPEIRVYDKNTSQTCKWRNSRIHTQAALCGKKETRTLRDHIADASRKSSREDCKNYDVILTQDVK